MGNKMDKVIFPTSDYIEINPPTKSLCGSIASFSDGGNAPIPSLTASIVPVQDLHGYDSPWAGGAGKNKLQNVRSTTTINGITFTVNNDGSVFIAGGQTASEFTVFNLIANNLNYYNLTDFGLSYNTDYIINGCPSGGSSTTYRLVFRSGGQAGNKVDAGTGVSFNIASDSSTLKWMPCIMIDANYTIPSGGLLFKPMIRLATVSDATFAPYSNICPISGWTEEVITRCGKNWCPTAIADNIEYIAGDYGTNITINDGVITYNLTITASTYFLLKAFTITKQHVGKTFTMSYSASPSLDDAQCILVLYDGTNRTNLDKTVTITDEMVGKDLTLRFYKYGSGTYTISNIQLEQGTTATTYEPYAGTTTTIPFTDGQGQSVEVFGGEIDVINGGEQPRTLGKIIVDENTDVKVYGGWRFYFDVPNFVSPAYNIVANIQCDKLTTRTKNSMPNTNSISAYDTGGARMIISVNDTITTVEDMKAWLANNPLEIVYELATPTTFYTQPTSIKSLDGENNVSASTGDVCVTYVTQEYQDLTVNFAATASKLGSSNVGSATQPIYLNGGTATACTYTLGKSVPSDAVFTDTDTKVTQTATTTNADYEVLFSYNADNTTRTQGARKSNKLIFNPSKQSLTIGSRATNSTIGSYSFVQGNSITASGIYSQGTGQTTSATGDYSHTEGFHTTANHKSQHVFGEYNIADPSTAAATARGNYVEIVGNGTSSTSSNARTLDWDGNEWLAGSLTIPYNETSSGYTYTASIGQGKIRVENNSAFPIYTEMEYDGIKLSDNRSSSRSDNIISPSDITISTTWDGSHTSLKAALTPEVVTSSTVDLNNYTSSGKWIMTGKISTKTNFPAGYPGELEVVRWSEASNDHYCRQDFKIYNTDRYAPVICSRIGTSSNGTSWNWSAWYSENYMLPNESLEFSVGYPAYGFITTSGTEMHLYFPVYKYLNFTNGVKTMPSSISCTIRQNGKYIGTDFGAATCYPKDWYRQKNIMELVVYNSSGTATAWKNATNNCEVTAIVSAAFNIVYK